MSKHTTKYEWVICPHCHNKLCKNYHAEFEIEIKCHGCKAVHQFFKTEHDSNIHNREIVSGDPKRHYGNRHRPDRFK